MSNANPGSAGTYVVDALPAQPSYGYQPGSIIIVRAATPLVYTVVQDSAGAVSFVQVYPVTVPADTMPRTQILTVTPNGPGQLIYRWQLATADGNPVNGVFLQVIFSTIGGLAAVTPNLGSFVALYPLDANTDLVLYRTSALGYAEFIATGTAGNAVDSSWVSQPYCGTTNTNAFPP